MAQVAIPLTTTFTPPASCAPTPLMEYLTFEAFIYPDTAQPNQIRSECFPSGYQQSSAFSPAPSICPVGYTVACNTTAGEVTSAVCCPSSYPCQGVSWWVLASTNYPCGGGPSYPFAYTGLFVTVNGESPVVTTTTFTSNVYANLNTINSEASGILIVWQSSDLPGYVKQETSTDKYGSTGTTSSFPSQTSSSPDTPPSSSGLSTGAKAGIGVGVTLVALFAIALAFFIVSKRRRAQKKARTERTSLQELESKRDRPELEGDRGVELPTEVGKQNMQRHGIAELPAERSRSEKGQHGAVELP